jgi:hypothetical protein
VTNTGLKEDIFQLLADQWQGGFMRVLKRLFVALFVAAALVKSGFAQKALTWQEVRDKFQAANPGNYCLPAP